MKGIREIEAKVTALELAFGPGLPRVIRCGSPRTAEQSAQIQRNVAGGQRFAIMPVPVVDLDEWLARYAVR